MRRRTETFVTPFMPGRNTVSGAALQEGQERFLSVLPRQLRAVGRRAVDVRSGVRLGALSILHTRFEVEPLLKELNATQVTVFCSSGGVQRRQQPRRLVVPGSCFVAHLASSIALR